MPETGSQILDYTGNAALGTGANANIPVYNPNSNLDTINDTAKNIAYLNHDNAIKLYDQKIKDRDTTLDLLAKGEIASGKIDPNDRPYYDDARKKVEDSFYDMANNGGINNTAKYKDYLDKASALKNVVDWAQGRQIELGKLQQESADQTTPEDKALYDQHIQQQQQKPFWQPIDPIQKAFKYDINGLTSEVTGQPTTLGLIGEQGTPSQTTTWQSTTNKTDKNGNVLPTTKTTTKTAPSKTGLINNKTSKNPVTISGTNVSPDGSLSPYSYTPEQYYDYPTIQKNVDELATTNGDKRYGYQSFFNDFQNPDLNTPTQQKSTIEAYNNRIAQYSQQRGIAPLSGQFNPDGTPKYPDSVKYHQNSDGSVIIQETPASFFGKHALASINGDYVQKPQAVFNKDIGNFEVQKEKADADSFYKHALGNSALTKAGAYASNLKQQMKLRKDTADQDNFLNEIYVKNIVQQPLIQGEGNNTASLAPINAQNSLPVYTLEGKTPVQLKPIGSKDIIDRKTGKVTGYTGGHYEQQYLLNDTPLNIQQLTDNYKKFQQTKFGKNWQNGLEGYLKEAVKNGLYNVNLKGANGTTNKDLSLAAQRIISNQTTKKGQTATFDNNEQEPADAQDQSNDNTQTDNQ